MNIFRNATSKKGLCLVEPAETLKKDFVAYGRYYQLQLGGIGERRMRSVLEIAHRELNIDPAELEKQPANAVVIMMNPGGSRPSSDDALINERPDAERHGLVAAVPDRTQYQIMRLMRCFNWMHVRVLNLSDIVEPKSSLFYPLIARSEKVGFSRHSIFAPDREQECKYRLSRMQRSPIICAWGVNKSLAPLAHRVLARTDERAALCGFQKKGYKDRYYHPLPQSRSRQEQWLVNAKGVICSYLKNI